MATTPDTLGPPSTSTGVLGWLRKNLFSTWYNALISIAALWLAYTVVSQFLIWAFTGAQWSVIAANLRLFMTGPFPPDQVWRVWVVLLLASALMGLSAGAFGGTLFVFGRAVAASFVVLAVLPFDTDVRIWLLGATVLLVAGYFLSRRRKRWQSAILVLWLVSFVVTLFLLSGFEGLLKPVGTYRWGGLLLTFMLAIVSIVA